MPASRRFVPAALLAVALSGAAAFALVPDVHATLVAAVDLDTLVRDSDEVVLAQVIKEWTLYDDKGRIVTDYQMQVERVEKGSSTPGAAIIVRKLGGMIGEVGMKISGEPSFKVGEVVVVFASRGQKTYLRPVGMGQGTLRVFEQEGERWARSDAEGMTLVARDQKSVAKAAVPAPRKVDELLLEVRGLVQQHAKQGLPVGQ